MRKISTVGWMGAAFSAGLALELGAYGMVVPSRRLATALPNTALNRANALNYPALAAAITGSLLRIGASVKRWSNAEHTARLLPS